MAISTSSRIARFLLASLTAMALSGCIGIRLKNAEIAQLNGELAAVQRTTASLDTMPRLSYAVVSADAINQFLSMLVGYKLVLDHPKGAIASIRSAQINFKDGVAEALIEAEATDRNNLISIKLRVVSDVCVTASDSALHLRFSPLEILPGIKVSIFRWHEFLFVASLLRLKAADYANSMPDVVIPLKSIVHLDVDAPTEMDFSLGSATLQAREVFPDRHLLYELTLANSLVLHEGIHLFLSLNRDK